MAAVAAAAAAAAATAVAVAARRPVCPMKPILIVSCVGSIWQGKP